MTVLEKCTVQFGHGGSLLCSSRRQISCSLAGLLSVVDLEDNLKHYTISGSRVGSLRAEIAQCSLVEVWWKMVVRSDKC